MAGMDWRRFFRYTRGADRVGIWWAIFGPGGVLAVMYGALVQAFKPIAEYGWAAIALSAIGFALLTMLIVSALLVAWRFFRPLQPATETGGVSGSPEPQPYSRTDLDKTFTAISNGIDALSGRVDSQFDGVEQRIGDLSEEIQRIRATLSSSGLGGLLDPGSRLDKVDTSIKELAKQQGILVDEWRIVSEEQRRFEQQTVDLLRAKQNFDLEKYYKYQINSRADRLSSAADGDFNSDWSEWENEFDKWQSDVESFCSIVAPYANTPVREPIFDTPPELYKSVHWTLDEAAFPNRDAVHDFKAFKIIFQQFQRVGDAALTSVNRAALV